MALQLSWASKLALIEYYKPTQEQIKSTFGVTQDDLDTALSCKNTGSIKVDTQLDVVKIGNVFTDQSIVISKLNFATKPKKELKQRGRKGDKITKAFLSIPLEPTPVTQFIEQHDISLPVLRQSKRFDKSQLPGAVNVKKMAIGGSTDKQLMVWRS